MGRFLLYIAMTTFLAGTLDGLAACIQYEVLTGKNPVNVLIFIASGIFGDAAFSGGAHIPWLGVMFHYLIAFIFTLVYFQLYPYLLPRNTPSLMAGIIYGIIVWVIMNLVVVPLSATPPPTAAPSFSKRLTGMLILIFCIGWPIAAMAKRYYADGRSFRRQQQ